MKHILFLLFNFVSVSLMNAQSSNDIQIRWIDTPIEVNDSHITLEWGIKSKSQIMNVSILLNGSAVKGINPVVNDGFDMKRSQVLKLEKGDNLIEIHVSTIDGSTKSSKTITLLTNDGNDNHGDFGDYENVDSMIIAAYRGNCGAQYLLAKSYFNGTNGLEKDLFESSLWFKKSAEHHHALSQYEYAMALIDGHGILKNMSLAIYWLTQSANKDCAEAQLKLGLCYENGDGVEQNVKKAKELYRKCPLPEAKQRLMALEKQ